jgi:small GTP-binding protein
MISTLSEEDSANTYKIILLGKSAAGKTKLLVRYLYQTYQDAGNTTVMVDCSFRKQGNARFAYYDTAGQEAYRSILNLYFKGTDAALLIYSVDDPSTL